MQDPWSRTTVSRTRATSARRNHPVSIALPCYVIGLLLLVLPVVPATAVQYFSTQEAATG